MMFECWLHYDWLNFIFFSPLPFDEIRDFFPRFRFRFTKFTGFFCDRMANLIFSSAINWGNWFFFFVQLTYLIFYSEIRDVFPWSFIEIYDFFTLTDWQIPDYFALCFDKIWNFSLRNNDFFRDQFKNWFCKILQKRKKSHTSTKIKKYS